MAGLKLLMCIFVAALSTTEGARILGLFPVPARSHMNVMRALMNGLADQGHQVTMVTPYAADKPHPNITELIIERIMFSDKAVNMFQMGGISPIFGPLFMTASCITQTDETLKHPLVQKLIQSKDDHFDLVVVEAFFNEAYVAFAHKFKAPLVQLCPFSGMHWMYDWAGTPSTPSYIPETMLGYDAKMTFQQRVANGAVMIYWKLLRSLYYNRRQEAIMRTHFEKHVEDLPSLDDLLSRTSLMLFNTHFTIGYPRPLTPNAVHVAGMHVKAPKKLPQDLQKYLDDAKDGAIFFSMGSNLRSADMPEQLRTEILAAFSQMKQRILWKWEEDVLPGQPKNVRLGKWLPQSDILAHPNIRLFITHGGGLSTQEAVARGVPVVGIPVFGDQIPNMDMAVKLGLGAKLDLKNVTTKSLLWAVTEVLQPKYRANAQKLSQLFKDQPMSPLETAVYWTEYVIRHKGAPHMRSAAVDLYWFQYLLLDVIAFLAIVAISLLVVTSWMFRALYRTCCRSKVHTKQKKQ